MSRPGARLSEAEIARRLPVWTALSDLFLDTELDAPDFDRIAAMLSASGYAYAELRRIFEGEVAPVLGLNLYAVAGEWAGWDQAFVRDRVLAAWPPSMGWVRRWLTSGARRMAAREWAEGRLG